MSDQRKYTLSLPDYDVDITFRPKRTPEPAPVPVPKPGPGPLLVEKYPNFNIRPRLVGDKLRFLPELGPFNFPAPYNTECIRLTNYQDGRIPGGVEPIGGNYWLRTNNHLDRDTMDILLCERKDRGGFGPYILTLDKASSAVISKDFIVPENASNALRYSSAEFWYFSAAMATSIYANDGPRMLRYDYALKESEVVFNAGKLLARDDIYINHMHSSDNDRVHCCTVLEMGTWLALGCMVYFEDTRAHRWFPAKGEYDESIVTRDGRYLIIFENLDGKNGEDNRIIDLHTGDEFLLADEMGAGGHHDVGDEIMIAADNWYGSEPAWRKWSVPKLLDGDTVLKSCAEQWYQAPQWFSAPQYISYRKGLCVGGSVNKTNPPHGNEFIAFSRDKPGEITILAPTMSTISGDSYNDMPRGVLDVSGQYFVFTANLGGPHRDAFLLKIPSNL